MFIQMRILQKKKKTESTSLSTRCNWIKWIDEREERASEKLVSLFEYAIIIYALTKSIFEKYTQQTKTAIHNFTHNLKRLGLSIKCFYQINHMAAVD